MFATQSLNSRYAPISNGANRQHTTTSGAAVQMHRTCATETSATAKFRTQQLQMVAQNPKQWSVCLYIYGVNTVIYREFKHGVGYPLVLLAKS
jgi:hypothetical protein